MKQNKSTTNSYSPETSIDAFNFSMRVRNALHKNNITTIGQLAKIAKLNQKELLELENFGKTSLNEVLSILDSIKIVGLENNFFIESLDNYNFSKRARTVFKTHNINSITDLKNYSVSEIKDWRNIGKETINEIIDVLASIQDGKSCCQVVDSNSEIIFLQTDKTKTFSLSKKNIRDYNFSNRALKIFEEKKN